MTTQAELAQTIRDLLRIAKVAMPPDLYGQDPRITRATLLLDDIERSTIGFRPPSVDATGIPASVRIADLARRRAVEASGNGIAFITELPWDLVEAMQAAQMQLPIPLDPSDAVSYAVRELLTGLGYLPAPPENVS